MSQTLAEKPSPVDGILLIDKPVGPSSNAALGQAKRLLGLRKAGHAGTLDPMASGLLVLCFGQATKVASWLLEADKTYEADVKLGQTTTTDDAEGELLEARPVPELSAAALEQALAAFRGPIAQVPPMHSALKHEGQRLYELARRGQSVERPARQVHIHELILLEQTRDQLRLQVHCSKGTYIRALARDLGEQLGCGAHLAGLRRSFSAPFSVQQAHSLDALAALDEQAARARLLPAEQALADWPEVRLDEAQEARIRLGQRLAGLELLHEGLVRMQGVAHFIGVGRMDGTGRLQPVRVFVL